MQHYAVIIFPSLLTSFDFPNASPRKLFYFISAGRDLCRGAVSLENPAAAEPRLRRAGLGMDTNFHRVW